ncbi:MAG: type VI secretion system tube protein Hcp [Betaproteobacteria bacterium]|nr:type VI secretion system tube protein Hcp [Betaproteobacteria bacterium]
MPVETQPSCSNPEAPFLKGKTGSGTLSVSKKYDASSPALLKFLIKNGVIEEGIFTMECEDGLPRKITIKNALVTKIFLDSYHDGIHERVHLVYGDIIF